MTPDELRAAADARIRTRIAASTALRQQKANARALRQAARDAGLRSRHATKLARLSLIAHHQEKTVTDTFAQDPWSQSNVIGLPTPNVFHDLDGNPVTVTTERDDRADYVQIKFGTTEIRLDPIEAQFFGDYVAKTGDELVDQVVTEVSDALRAEDALKHSRPVCPLHGVPKADGGHCTCDL